MACYLQKRFSDAGTVLHFHGNGELASEYYENFAELFLSRGVNVCFADYRGYGLSSGIPAVVAMQSDGEKIVEALGLAPNRLVAFGRSLGSVYAVELAYRVPQIGGVVLESAIANVVEDWPLTEVVARLGQAEDALESEVKAHFDLQMKLQRYQGHVLVLHAENDRSVDRSHADRLYSWAGSSNKRLVVFPNGDHNTIFFANASRYLNELAGFFQRAGIVSKNEMPS